MVAVRCEIEVLKVAVEAIDDARVVAVDIHFRVPGLDL
jgi:hypothetical protein